MRRGFSLFLILLITLGPLAATVQGDDDSRVPACCRRDGAHHCVMSEAAARLIAEAYAGKSIFTAPSTCPRFPGSVYTVTNSIHALAAAPVDLSGLAVNPLSPSAAQGAARISEARTRSSRAPPAQFFS
jgi:hypothetical protein